VVELVAGEGGLDSRQFLAELLAMYLKWAVKKGLKPELWASSEAHAVIHVTGKGAGPAFRWEGGNHVVQRVPSTEKHGRRQTSVVSVMALPLPPEARQDELPDKELDIKFQAKGGPGGQHRNKTASACRMRHVPTGLSVFIDGRDQHANRREAYRILCARVAELRNRAAQDGYDGLRREQFSGGGRGGKVRTYSFIESFVADHRTERRTTNIKDVMKGDLTLVLPA
jgi:peptide chain release factor 1